MTELLLEELRKVTPEEQRILEGSLQIEKDIYMSMETDVVDGKKLLESGKLIQVRTHTRFIHFPKHSHNYIEVIYMCEGSTHHVINGKDVILETGELLFLNQCAKQEIYPAGEHDIAVNFIILPEFFFYGLKMIETEENLLRDFVIGCLTGKKNGLGYMHFKVSDILPIQNLVENLIWTIWNKQTNRRSINQATMGLVFLQLMNYMERMEMDAENEQRQIMMQVLGYIEEHYRDGELTQLAENLHYDIYWLSKEIKRQSGYNYIDLLQTKRLNQAAYLLTHTSMSIMEIGMAVGYDNMSYFHRIFQNKFNTTPRKYRVEHS